MNRSVTKNPGVFVCPGHQRGIPTIYHPGYAEGGSDREKMYVPRGIPDESVLDWILGIVRES